MLRYAFSISALPSLDKELWAEITKISNCPTHSLPLFLIAVFFEWPHPTNSFYSQVYTLFLNMFLCSKAFLYSFNISTGLNMSSDSWNVSKIILSFLQRKFSSSVSLLLSLSSSALWPFSMFWESIQVRSNTLKWGE